MICCLQLSQPSGGQLLFVPFVANKKKANQVVRSSLAQGLYHKLANNWWVGCILKKTDEIVMVTRRLCLKKIKV